MYSLSIREHIMIAHSLPGEVFGPAQGLHGATFLVDVEFFRQTLDSFDIVVDIGRASEVLKATLAELTYKNLDQHPDFQSRRSTTEVLAKWVWDRMDQAIRQGHLGAEAGGISRMVVTLHESHVALGRYQADRSSG